MATAKRKKPSIRIPREWYPLLPGQPLAFWVKVEALRKKKGIRKKDMGGIAACVDVVFNN